MEQWQVAARRNSGRGSGGGKRDEGDSRDIGNSRFVYGQGKRLAFLSGSPTTNRFDVAVGRKISLLPRLLLRGTRDRSLRAAPDFCHVHLSQKPGPLSSSSSSSHHHPPQLHHGSNLIERVPRSRCIYCLNELIPAQFTGY